MKVFKVRDMESGLFSTGGYPPRWSKKGKIWTRLADVKCHLRHVLRYTRKPIPLLWEIVELELVEGERYAAGAVVAGGEK